MDEKKSLRNLKDITEEIRAAIRELEEKASKSEVFIHADSESLDGPQVNIGPRKISFNQERGVLLRLIDLYNERAKLEA